MGDLKIKIEPKVKPQDELPELISQERRPSKLLLITNSAQTKAEQQKTGRLPQALGRSMLSLQTITRAGKKLPRFGKNLPQKLRKKI